MAGQYGPVKSWFGEKPRATFVETIDLVIDGMRLPT
jgi:hypothetical protein